MLEERRILSYFGISSSSPVQEPLTTLETKYAEFTISMSGPPGSGSVSWTASSQAGDTATANADYQVASGAVNLSPSQPSQTILILINYDVLTEPNETFRVTLSNPSSGHVIMAGTGYGTIIDAPVNPQYVNITPVQSAVLEGSSGQFRIARSSTVGPMTVYYQVDAASTVSGSDYTLNPSGSATFANGEGEVLITVNATDDDALELPETMTVELLNIAPGTVGPSQYLISGTGEASINFHDGFHGYVNTPFAVEYQNTEGTWYSAPDSETLWREENLKWLPTIPSEVAAQVDTITWLKRPYADPLAGWVSFATGTVSNPATGNPGLGHWDITFMAFYDIVSYFLAAPVAKGVNDIAGVSWEKGHADQKFGYLDAKPGPEVFPEQNVPGTQNFNTVKVNVSLVVPCASTTTCPVNLRALDPDHHHNPENADDKFDPNDVFGAGPNGTTDIKPMDNRKSTGEFDPPYKLGSPLLSPR